MIGLWHITSAMPRRFTSVFELTTSVETFDRQAETALRRLDAIPLWRRSWIVRTDLSEAELRTRLNGISSDGEWQISASSRGDFRHANFKDKQKHLKERP